MQPVASCCVVTNSCLPVCTRSHHSPTVLLTRVPCSVSVEPNSDHVENIHILVKLSRTQKLITPARDADEVTFYSVFARLPKHFGVTETGRESV